MPQDPMPEPPWWTPARPVAPRAVTREEIVEAALRVLKAEGIDAVNMRRLATEVSAGAAAIYARVAHKDELLEQVYDRVMAEVVLPTPDPDHWQDQIRQIWQDSFEALARSGDIARVAIGGVPLGPNSMRVAETVMAILRVGGLPDREAVWAVDTVGLYVAANAVEDAPSAEEQRKNGDSTGFYQRIHAYLGTLPVERFPTIGSVGSVITTGDRRERFTFGLDLIVSGLAVLSQTPAEGSITGCC